MFSIDVKVNGKTKYLIQGRNITPRGNDYGGICVYEAFVDKSSFTLSHERRQGLLRLCGKVINKLCREVESGNFDRKLLEHK